MHSAFELNILQDYDIFIQIFLFICLSKSMFLIT